MNPVVLVFLAMAALWTYWLTRRCPGDTCPTCRPAIDHAEDQQTWPDPDDAPDAWEPR